MMLTIARRPANGSAWRPQIYVMAVAALIAAYLLTIASQQSNTPSRAFLAPAGAFTQTGQALAFEPNVGQTDPAVHFMVHAPGGTIFFTGAGLTVKLKSAQIGAPADEAPPAGAVVSLAFVGAQTATLGADSRALSARVNYFIGNNRANWHSAVPVYAAISYSSLYPGVSLQYKGTQGQLKGTYTVAAGADPGQIRWQYSGVGNPTVDGAGNLIFAGAGSSALLTEQAPVAWQQIGANKVPVAVGYQVGVDGLISFALGTYNRAEPLIIDPTLIFSTFLGGSGQDESDGIAVDSSGAVYVTGFTDSTNFPTLEAYQSTNKGSPDAFVTKFNADGTLAYSSYLGGSGTEKAYGIAVDSGGAAYIAGYTSSNDFPTQNAYQTSDPSLAAFLTKLNSSGSALLYSTYFGGSANDFGWGIAVGSGGNAYFTGNTASTDFPTKNAYQPVFGGGAKDAFLVRLDTTQAGSASLIYSTYLGGSAEDEGGGDSASIIGHGVAVDPSGDAFVTGQTASTNFPTHNAYDATNNGGVDAWVAKVGTNQVGAASLIYSTYLGGSNCCDYGRDVAIDATGAAYVTGQTNSANFPTMNAYHDCSVQSPFVTKLNPAGTGLVYSTCFGAAGSATDIAVDGAGRAHIAGLTNSNFPQVNPLQSYGGGDDAFALVLNATGDTLVFSTYLGGSASELGVGVASDGANKTYVSGATLSANFATHNAYQPACSNNCAFSDAFVAIINDQAATVTPSSTSTRTATRTSTSLPTRTATRTSTPTATNSATAVATATKTHTATPSFTASATHVATSSPTPRATFTPVPGDQPPVVTVPLNRPYRVGVVVGNYLALRFDASDPDVGDSVVLSVSNLPAGASFPLPGAGNPIHTTLTWRTTAADIGVYFVTVIATDSHGSVGSAVVEIDVVAGCVPYFSDVYTNQYFYVPVHYLFCHLVISGYTEPDQTFTFRPFNETTRSQFSKMIALAYNLAAYNPPTPDFNDVQTTNPFYAYIEAAYHAGIISGYADGTFHPFASITRGQLSKLIVRAAGWSINTGGGPHFTDVSPTSPFYAVIETAFNHGVISGYMCGGAGELCDGQNHAYFRAFNSATRGQITKILWLALGSPPNN